MRRISSAPVNTAPAVWTVMTQSSAKWDRIASTSFASTALKYESGRAASWSLDSRAVCVATSSSLDERAPSLSPAASGSRASAAEPGGDEVVGGAPGRDAVGIAARVDLGQRVADALERAVDLGAAPPRRLATAVGEDAARFDQEGGGGGDAAPAEPLGVARLAGLVVRGARHDAAAEARDRRRRERAARRARRVH